MESGDLQFQELIGKVLLIAQRKLYGRKKGCLQEDLVSQALKYLG